MTGWCPLCDAPGAPLAAGVAEPAVGVAEPVERYAGRYRVPSARLAGFDYGRGVFFVTVVTAGRVPWFGRLADGRVRLLPPGRVVAEEWARTGVVRADVTVDALVVMPDHVHGILALGGEEAVPGIVPMAETPQRGVSTGPGAAWTPGVLGSVVNQIKGRCTKRIRPHHPAFGWQARFHDIVVRDEHHLEAARRYIVDNPARAPRS